MHESIMDLGIVDLSFDRSAEIAFEITWNESPPGTNLYHIELYKKYGELRKVVSIILGLDQFEYSKTEETKNASRIRPMNTKTNLYLCHSGVYVRRPHA